MPPILPPPIDPELEPPILDPSVLEIVFDNVRLSQNRLEIHVPAVDASVTDRNKLRYYLDIFVPNGYQSDVFEALIRLEASEVPPYESLGSTIYEGAYFPIDNYLDSLLTRKAPLFNQTNFLLCEDLTLPFYLVYTRMNDDVVIDSATLPTEHILKAGINEKDFPIWKEAIFKSKLGLANKFLTWSIDNKMVDADQPEFLYYLTNANPAPTTLRLVVTKKYANNAALITFPYTLTGILPFSVYCFPVGIKALGIDTDPLDVLSYLVTLDDGMGGQYSETREYEVDSRYHRNNKYILFSNSLGGFDTLRAVGQSIESLKVSRQTSERYYPFASSATYSEKIINQITGERELTIRTGFLSKAELDYLQELVFSKEFYLKTDREFIPLLLVSGVYINHEDDVNIRGREFVFVYANAEYNYSRLVIPPAIVARTKAWRVFGSPSCDLNSHGIRTGNAMYPFLEQYYTDDNVAVVPQTIKKNIVGIEGYIASYPAMICESTPYLNARIERAVTYRYVGNCQNPYIGNYPNLVIEANTWGSEVSQADADAKAEAEWAALNTQVYANGHGACVLMKYVNVAIRRNGTLKKNDCVMIGYIGTSAEIVIAAGIYGSEISQADADGQAEAAFVAVDTQVYANEHGTCVYNFESGLRVKFYQYAISNVLDESVFDTVEPYLERNELRIDHGDGQVGTPSVLSYPPGVGHDNYAAAKFDGYLKAPISGVVRLYIRVADDEWAALYLNNSISKTLEKPDHVLSPSEVWVDVNMTAGEYIPLVLKYIEFSGYNLTVLSWSYAGQAKIVVPDSAYYRLVI